MERAPETSRGQESAGEDSTFNFFSSGQRDFLNLWVGSLKKVLSVT